MGVNMGLYNGVWSSHIHATIPHNMGCCWGSNHPTNRSRELSSFLGNVWPWRIRWHHIYYMVIIWLMILNNKYVKFINNNWLVVDLPPSINGWGLDGWKSGTYHENMDDDWEILVGGWALPLWKIMEFVSWDHDIPNIWRVIIHSCSSHHQPGNPWIFHSYPLPSGNLT